MNSLLKISKFCPETITKVNSRGLVSFKNFFGKKDKKEDKEDKGEKNEITNPKENLISTDFDAIKSIDTNRLTRVKAYKPQTNVVETIKNLCKQNFGKDYNEEMLNDLSFDNRTIKFNVLSECVNVFKHNIPNANLNDIKTVGDLINYYMTEQKDTSTLEDLSLQQDLPKNLHINLEYNRFDPEKDKLFDGKDAFPERNTIVTSLWYSKKYKSVIKKKPYFTK